MDTYSIYHFLKSISKIKSNFLLDTKLEDLPFDENLFSYRNRGISPYIAIRLNKNKDIFTGGELIYLKDSKSYTVLSFNSTIPAGKKDVSEIITAIKQQMKDNGEDIFSLPVRDVFYFVRGKRNTNTKACLVHGSFFETVKVRDLISQSFACVLDERLKESGAEISGSVKDVLSSIFSEQGNFSKVRSVEKASVKLRFRIMTEVKAEGNILNSKKYPEIGDDTLNFVLPCDTEEDEKDIISKAKHVFGENAFNEFKIFKIKHHLNGYFLVFQLSLFD